MSEYSMSGKLPPGILSGDVLSRIGAPRPEVLIGPALGEDAALIRWGGEPYLAAASDPVVGASVGAGRILVHVNANDVACKGADPAWFAATLIIPARDGVECVRRVMKEIHETCLALGVAVVGGHTELTDRYDRPVLSGTMMGPSRCNLRAEKIREGDAVLMTKHAGLEGMAILAHDRPDLLPFLSGEELAQARAWQNDLSVVKEARLLRDLARCMHDPTEGGLEGGLSEICASCGLRAELDPAAVPMSPLTERAAREIGFDPMRLISSGVLVAVLPPEKTEEALKRLREAGIPAKIIGRFTRSSGAGEKPWSTHEELWRILDL